MEVVCSESGFLMWVVIKNVWPQTVPDYSIACQRPEVICQIAGGGGLGILRTHSDSTNKHEGGGWREGGILLLFPRFYLNLHHSVGSRGRKI